MGKFLEYIKKYDILILIIIGVLFYFPSLFYGFVYDDVPFIVNNQYINGNLPINFFDFFTPKFVRDDIYIPFTFILYWGVIKIFGISSFALHSVNIFFYISSSIALFYLLKKIINNHPVVFFATILYILHPCHIENTAWNAAMGYNISALFFFLSFLLFISAFDKNKKIHYVYSVISYILAILSQPISVTLPAILFLWVFCFRRERLNESLKYISAYIPFLLIYFVLFYNTVCAEHLNRFNSLNYTFMEKLYIGGFELFNSFIPINLCPIQPLPNVCFIISFFLFLLFSFYFSKDKIYLFFILFGIITYLPYSNVFFNIAVPLADRYLLLSSISSCVFISYFSFYILGKLKGKYLLRYISFVFFIVLYIASFLFYIPNWKDNRTLWTYSYNINPDNILIATTYVDYLIIDKKYDEALILADNIIDKYPMFFESYEVKIRALIEKSLFQEAINICFKVKDLMPYNYKNYLYIFDIYIYQKEYEKAGEYLNLAEEIAIKNNLFKNNIIELLARKKIMLSYVNAEPNIFIDNFKIISSNFGLLKDRGKFLEILSKTDYKSREEICLDYLKKYDSEYSVAVIRLLNCLYIREFYKDKASKVMKHLLKEMSTAQEFINNKDYNSAEKIYLDIIKKNKYMYEAYKNLGILYLNTNRQDKARDIFGKMLEINPNDEQIRQILLSFG